MNKIIQEQLNQVKDADLSHFDKSTNTYFIPRKTSIVIRENNSYIIEIGNISDTITNNWNQGSKPPFNCCKAIVNTYMKNMIQIDGVEYDNLNNIDGIKVWSGWLPLNDVVILKEIKEE